MNLPAISLQPNQVREAGGPALIVVLAALTIASLLGPLFLDQHGQLDPLVTDSAFVVVGVMALITIGFTIRAMLLDSRIDRRADESTEGSH